MQTFWSSYPIDWSINADLNYERKEYSLWQPFVLKYNIGFPKKISPTLVSLKSDLLPYNS